SSPTTRRFIPVPLSFQKSCPYCTIFLAIWQTLCYTYPKSTEEGEHPLMRWLFGVVFQKKGNP
ncbi:MAG: hypothetical protein V8S13_01020, partial [Gemmiger formicilis]